MQLNKPSNSNDGIKQLYKKALKGKIPESVRLQVKRRGFSHPTSIWYRGPMRDYMYDTLLSRNDNRFYIFRKNVVRKMLDEHMSQKHNMDYQLDACLIFKL
jgi:asparagine synthase (glutamine-hydrolysing)